jgi:hypothetical protein
VNRASQSGRAGPAKGVGESRSGAAGGGLIAVDRQGNDSRMPECGEQLHKLHGFIGRLRSQQADTQSDLR